MEKIIPHLWFDQSAREAAEFYVSLLPGSRISGVTTLKDTPSGDCDLVSFELAGLPFMAISAGPLFKFNPAVSFHFKCETKEEVDAIWEQLSPGAKVLMPLGTYPFSERYGWLEDRFGLSWQVIHAGGSATGQRITPVLIFLGGVCGKAEEAINFYAAVFGTSESVEVLARYGEGAEPDREGTIQYAQFRIGGLEFGGMDSARGQDFAFNEAISFVISCESQDEIDYFWEKLSADPKAEQCGWLKDRYGLSWQVTPAIMQELINSGDQQSIERVTGAFLKMKKFDIAALRQAARG